MRKDSLFIGQPIFSQLLSLVNRDLISRLARKHQSDRYYKRFKTYDHLVTMLYSVFHKCDSIREVSTGMQACFMKLNHLGMNYCPRRSTLSDANKRRSSAVFEDIYYHLFGHLRRFLPDSQSQEIWHSKLYIADSTTISLFKEILKTGGRSRADGKRKGGIKVHALIKANEDVPCMVRMNAAISHDVKFIKGMQLPKGSFITFDKAYLDYRQYDYWTQHEVSWITRLKSTARFQVTAEHPLTTDQLQAGVLFDKKIILGKKWTYTTKARLIGYCDKQQGRSFMFITNNTTLPASSIALIYKHRWQIELLFKRIKQNFPLRQFLGDNENAIKIQIWCALIADLILRFIKSRLKRNWSYANLCSMIRIHLMSYIQLIAFLENPEKALINTIQVYSRGPTLFD